LNTPITFVRRPFAPRLAAARDATVRQNGCKQWTRRMQAMGGTGVNKGRNKRNYRIIRARAMGSVNAI